MKYIPRHIEDRIQEALDIHPVIVLSGPRQVGKSTLLENADFLKNWRYVTLDDADHLAQAKDDPKGLLREGVPTIIDEVQRCPELLITVKYYVDRSRRKRKFILSGSGNISLRKSPRETLAGRAKYLYLTGFAYSEVHRRQTDGMLNSLFAGKKNTYLELKKKDSFEKAVWRGSLPAVSLAPRKAVYEILGGYVDTYIERDIQDLVKVRQPEKFRKLMQALAQATGWESTQEELAKFSGETRSNISRHISLLKDTQILYELRGYVAKGERAYKQAKFYWFDSGVACFMTGIHVSADLKKPNLKGRFFENFVFQQILSWASLQPIHPEIYYWKIKEQSYEVDFVIRDRTSVLPIEVKSSDRLGFGDTRAIREFLKTHPEASRGMIIYNGKKVYPVASNVIAVPWELI